MSNNKPDYYKIMGLPEQCSFEEIKTQYRKLAMKHHPDKNPGNKESESLFKEINQAYSILSDPAKRAEYDVLRNSHFSSKHYDPFKDFNETMNHMFKQAKKEGQLSVVAELSLEQIELGSNFKFRYQGEIFNIQIPSGTNEGEVLMFTLPNGMGVEVTVNSKPHEYLERDGFDLFLDVPLTYGEIHQGVDLELQILGRRISLIIPKGLKFGTILRLKNQGLTSRTGVRGTIFVEIVPQHIDLTPDEVKQILKIEKKKEITRPDFIFTKQIK